MILIKTWGVEPPSIGSEISLIRNSNIIAERTNDGAITCDNKSGTITPLDEMEAGVYFVLDEQMRNENERLSNTVLGAYVCIHKSLFDEEQWTSIINDMCTEVANMTDDMLPENWGRLDIIQLAYVLGGQNGSITAEGKDMIIEHAARKLITEHLPIVTGREFEHIAEEARRRTLDSGYGFSSEEEAIVYLNAFYFMDNVWTAVKSLTERNVFVHTINP